jgi:hypothetical protein
LLVITLKAHKPQLLAILRLRRQFVIAYSEALGETILLCEDEGTKAALVEAGADEWSICTRAELQILVQHNRAKRIVPDELLKLHQAKRTFNARITSDDFK